MPERPADDDGRTPPPLGSFTKTMLVAVSVGILVYWITMPTIKIPTETALRILEEECLRPDRLSEEERATCERYLGIVRANERAFAHGMASWKSAASILYLGLVAALWGLLRPSPPRRRRSARGGGAA